MIHLKTLAKYPIYLESNTRKKIAIWCLTMDYIYDIFLASLLLITLLCTFSVFINMYNY